MDLYPAIDIQDGRVVRLSQGEATRRTIYGDDPAAMAERFVSAGARWIHVVDLDRAFGTGDNLAAVRRVLAVVGDGARVQLGGGLRTLDLLRDALELGVARAVVGTSAALEPDFVPAAVELAGAARVAVGIDARDGRVALRGWTETSALRGAELAGRVVGQGVSTIIYTDIARDGMLTGPDLAGAAELSAIGARVIASGGVTSAADIRAARDADLEGAIVGRALYEGRLTLADALRAAGPPSSDSPPSGPTPAER